MNQASANRIHKLNTRLANQIAAGEVVERPASVVKELLENSFDAGAKRIEINIDAGGHKLIRIRDDGCGIQKNDLTLALSPYSTSKIKELSDLNQLISMGFRGEALASISSVSKFLLISRTSDTDSAWQATVEGRDMDIHISPAPGQVGTLVEVKELFFNTPARRKFLRTEKTEFNQIEDVVNSSKPLY